YWKHLLGIAFCLMTVVQSVAQATAADKHYTDSIEGLVQKVKSDTSKALLLTKLSHYWFKKDTGKAADFARKALKISNGRTYYSALANYHLGISYYYGSPGKAKKYFQTTIDLLKGDTAKRSL